MFDDFRDQAGAVQLEEEEETFEEVKPLRRPSRRLFGMTAGQRLVIALMLLIMVCILGLFALLVTGKIVPLFL